MQKNETIYFVGGGKGGVGKSIVTMSLINFLLDEGQKVILVESDTSNPDVYKVYKDDIDSKLINLDEKEGWIELLNLCAQNQDSVIVVNTGARNGDGIKNFGDLLNMSVEELKRDFITFWVINRQKDSVELLKKFSDTITQTKVHVFRNTYFGDENKFEIYNNSNLRKTLEAKGTKSLNFPDLADRVSSSLYNDRLSIKNALKNLPFGDRVELERWTKTIKGILSEVIHA